MPLNLAHIKQQTCRFEGSVNHMYLDTVGKVTVGVGNMLSSVEQAQELPFVDRRTGRRATPQEIAADFEAVQRQPKGLFHGRYARCTKLSLPDEAVDALLEQRLHQFEGDLRRLYPGFDDFPEGAKLGLLDMAYNLGAGALAHRWPRLNAAVRSRDWAGVARESRRRGVNEERNAATRALFEAAALVTPR